MEQSTDALIDIFSSASDFFDILSVFPAFLLSFPEAFVLLLVFVFLLALLFFSEGARAAATEGAAPTILESSMCFLSIEQMRACAYCTYGPVSPSKLMLSSGL